jgi:hypothetical protein
MLRYHRDNLLRPESPGRKEEYISEESEKSSLYLDEALEYLLQNSFSDNREDSVNTRILQNLNFNLR